MNEEMKTDKPKPNTPGGVLAKVWEVITKNNNLNTPKKHQLLADYLNSTNTNSANIKRRVKSSMIANVTATEMSWKTFSILIFDYLKVRKMTISIKLTYNNGMENISSLVVNSPYGNGVPITPDISTYTLEDTKGASDDK